MSESTVEIPVIGVDRHDVDWRTAAQHEAHGARRIAARRVAPARRGGVRALFGAGWDLDWNWPRLVLPGDMATVVERIVQGAVQRRSTLLLTLNLDIWRRLATHASHRVVRRDYHCVLLDGAPIVWAYRHATGAPGHRVTGADLLPELTRAALRQGLHVHFTGGGPDVAAQVAGLFAEAEGTGRVSASSFTIGADLSGLAPAARGVAVQRPDIVFAAYGFPKQDALGAAILDACPGTTVIGVGAAFDFALGRFRRAPRAVQAMKMEWMFRLLQEPRRLASRYLVHGLPALVPLVRSAHRLGRRRQGDG